MSALSLPLRRRAWAAWLAVFGLVCAPTLSHALAAARDGGWVEVCSVQGSRRVPLEPASGRADQAGQLAHALAHCALCGLASDAGLAPPAALAGLPAPCLATAAPRARPAWAPAATQRLGLPPPRAPPAPT